MSKTKRRSSKDVNHEEIQALLTKLKEIVPNMPRNRKLSKLEIIQHVIDYIVDLQIALEAHPSSMRTVPPRNSNSSTRQPLGLISSSDNSAANTYAVSEVNQRSKNSVCCQEGRTSASTSSFTTGDDSRSSS